jgi:hypothetical protein
MSRMVSRARIAQAAAVLLGLVVLGMLALTVVLDSLTHYPGTGGPLVDSLAVASAGLPAAAVATLLVARRPGNPIGWLLFGVFVVPVATGHAPGYPNNPVISALVVLAFGAMPASLGVAVLKYRLYELDRIISRVVSYTLITAVLVGFYTGIVLLTTHVLPFKSAVTVAACTLITAALFNPLRRRVQRAVDRRFNRSRYNAEAVVAAFTARMRQTVDFDAVRDDLVGVVHEAFQPTQASVWLAEAGSGLENGARTGAQPWARLYAEGHGEHWADAADYIERNLPAWRRALR